MSEHNDDHGSGWTGIEHVQPLLEMLPGGPVVRHLIDTMPGVQTHRAGQMVDQLLAFASTNSHALIRRLEVEPRLRRLLWEASRAAADTELEDKIRGLAHVAARAVRDDAAIDVSQLVIRTLAAVEALHVRVLVTLDDAGAKGPQADASSVPELLGIDDGVAVALCADLLRLGLIETGGMSFTGTYTSARLSPFGEDLLRLLRE